LRKILYAELAEKGITSCELKGRFAECTGNLFLSLAHSKKRRDIKTEADMREVILCCCSEHQVIEYLPNMYNIVTEVIAHRG
jgi:hypothetical protein